MEKLLEQEREARIKGDVDQLKQIFIDLVSQCTNDRDIVALIRILSLKRGQDRSAIKWLIKELYNTKRFEPTAKDFFTLLLSEVVEGKIYLEDERVYITETLKRQYEKEENYALALSTIINVPVETFTMVSEHTIIKYQFEQFKLCLRSEDWIRADITMKKIRKKYFEENDVLPDKILFYEYVSMLYLGQKKFLDAAKIYFMLSEYVEEKTKYVAMASFYCIISTCECEMRNIVSSRYEFLTKLSNDANNDDQMRNLVKKFTGRLIISNDMISSICALRYLKVDEHSVNFNNAVFEHNFRIIESFYSSITLQMMATIMGCEVKCLISRMCFMVNNKFTDCRIDQKNGVVTFTGRRWNGDVGDVLTKMIKINHLIHKEKMKSATES